MKLTHLFIVPALALAPLSAAAKAPAPAESTPATADATLYPIPKLTGSIWERERLLGDLGGPRQTLAEHGVQFDFNLTQIYQGVLSGGETDEWARSIATTALRTLTGEILDRAAIRRVQVRAEIEAIAQQRLQELGAKARARFAALPRVEQFIIQRKLAAVPAGTWENLRSRVRTALESKIASGREALNEFFQDKISKLNLGNFGNVGQDEGDYFGSWEFNVKLDTQKMGLWPGGFVFMRVQGIYGDSVNSRSGALLPVNANALMPEPGLDDVTIPHLYFTQFLSPHVALAVGKLDTSGGDANEFAHYTNNETFLNLAFAFNPVTAATVPYSTLGATLILLPTKNLTITLGALDGEGVATRSGFDTAFEGKTTYTAEATLVTNLFNLPGHHLLGGTYGRGSYGELRQELSNFLPGGGGLARSKDSWSIYYNLQQYFWTTPEDKTRGWGIFGRAGVADKQTNPIAQFYSVGFGGKGVGTARPYDRWGVGYYYMKTSGELPDFLRLDDEQGGEAFYNFAITPAFMITADIQVVDSARELVDTAVIGAVRATLRF